MLILLHCRQILSSSYAFGFFIPDTDKKHKKEYEALQVGKRAGAGDCLYGLIEIAMKYICTYTGIIFIEHNFSIIQATHMCCQLSNINAVLFNNVVLF